MMANVTSDELLFTIAENMKACSYQPHMICDIYLIELKTKFIQCHGFGQ